MSWIKGRSLHQSSRGKVMCRVESVDRIWFLEVRMYRSAKFALWLLGATYCTIQGGVVELKNDRTSWEVSLSAMRFVMGWLWEEKKSNTCLYAFA